MLSHIQLSLLFKSLGRFSFPLKMCNTTWLDLSSGYWWVLLCFVFVYEHLVIDKELLSTVISYPGDEKSCVYRWCSYRMTELQSTWAFYGLESHPYSDWVFNQCYITTTISTTAIIIIQIYIFTCLSHISLFCLSTTVLFNLSSDLNFILFISPGFNPWVGKIPWRREQLPTLVHWPGEFHGQRSLTGYSRWGHTESDKN